MFYEGLFLTLFSFIYLSINSLSIYPLDIDACSVIFTVTYCCNNQHEYFIMEKTYNLFQKLLISKGFTEFDRRTDFPTLPSSIRSIDLSVLKTKFLYVNDQLSKIIRHGIAETSIVPLFLPGLSVICACREI